MFGEREVSYFITVISSRSNISSKCERGGGGGGGGKGGGGGGVKKREVEISLEFRAGWLPQGSP